MSEIKYNRPRGRLLLEDFKKIKDYNEVDLLLYMSILLNDARPMAELMIRGEKKYRVELRKHMNDIINLSYILRGMVGVRMELSDNNRALDELIDREALYEKKLNKREMGPTADEMLEKIIQVRLAEQNRRKEREQKRQEEGNGASGGEHQKTPDQL